MGFNDPVFRRSSKEHIEALLAGAVGPTRTVTAERLFGGDPIKIPYPQTGPVATYFYSAAMEAAGIGTSVFWHLQAEQGALLVVGAPSGILVVAVAEPDVNVGLVRLELLRAAEVVA